MNEEIDKYINNELRGSHLKRFENSLYRDPELMEEYKLQKEVNNALKENEVMSLRAQLNEINVKSQNLSRNSLFTVLQKSRKWIAAASVFLLLAIGGIGYYYLDNPPTKEEIFNEYYKPYEATVSYRSAESELNSLLTQAFKAYKNEKFSKALGLFQQVLRQREDVAARMYSGISYIEIDELNKANKSFRKVVNNKDNLFVDQAKWYMSICYVGIGDLDKAKHLLVDLQTTSEYYSSKSKEIIEKLEKAKKKD